MTFEGDLMIYRAGGDGPATAVVRGPWHDEPARHAVVYVLATGATFTAFAHELFPIGGDPR